MTKKEKKMMAQDLIMRQISIIGYGSDWNDFVEQMGSQEEAEKIAMEQMNRVARLFGFEYAWFS